ncbi:hypothetical protein ACEQ8H_006711 [Pleosporales sp. CAS-2024a]
MVDLRRLHRRATRDPPAHADALALALVHAHADAARLRRVMSRLRRVDDAATPAYGDVVPSANRLYDWSPAAGESLRSTAILQSVRRHPRFSARAGEGARPPRESSARVMSESVRQMALQRMAQTEPASSSSLDHGRRSDSAHAPAHAPAPATSHPPPALSPLLEQTVKYLARVRHAETMDDSLNLALDAGFLRKDYFCMHYPDFVTDTATLPPPPPTSWLAPGAVLEGCQHATATTALQHMYSLPPPTRPWLNNHNRNSTSHSPDPTQQDRWPVKVTIHAVDWHAMTLSATMEAYNVPSHPHPHQSLVTTHHHHHHHYTRTSSITTYLEGEMLDFNTHTLLTESFKSTAANDATYWRKLPPFSHMPTDQDVVKALTSRKWFHHTLNKEYILMRWKERCFVKNHSSSSSSHPSSSSSTTTTSPSLHTDNAHATFDDSGCGLTISGFYYTCLRRADGALKGLYFDPQSSPYQCLELESKRGGTVGAWAFR